ncbi:hypothetical protein PMAYCL1PPCAC_15969, partial [Pristionchus mayeri]
SIAYVFSAIVDVKTQMANSTKIDESLQKEKNEDTTRVKILLLGGADAGKSTIVKQMRILHMNGFSDDEMRSFQKYLRYNLFQIFHEIAIAIHSLIDNIEPAEENEIIRFAQGIEWIISVDHEEEIEHLLNFFNLKCVRKFMEVYPNFSSLPDNAFYYIPMLSTLLTPGYVLTSTDILHLRIPTTSVNEINFNLATRSIRLIDVGGQRSYRKKWIHCFDGVAAVLFVASMASYDQVLDDVDKAIKPVLHKDALPVETVKAKPYSRLRDSVQLFGDMLRNEFLITAAFILFLNKKDLFLNKLSTHPLRKYVNGYKGQNDNDACAFMKDYFLKRKSTKDRDRSIYAHFCTATDTKNIEFVFKAACEIALTKNLLKTGIQ